MPVGLDYTFRWNNYAHPNLVLAYDMFTRTSGGLMKNLAPTGSTYDGTIGGTYTPATTLIRTKKTPCMDFDGANNFITLTNPVSNAAQFSLLFWANDDTNGTAWSRSTGATGVVYHYAASFWLFYSGDYLNTHVRVPTLITDFYALTYNGTGRVKWYINGNFDMSYPSPSAVYWPDPTIYIGQYFDGTLRYNGRIDNMLVYNVELTPAQVSSIYRSAVAR